MSERNRILVTLPLSLLLWITGIFLLGFFLNHSSKQAQLTGRNLITVRLAHATTPHFSQVKSVTKSANTKVPNQPIVNPANQSQELKQAVTNKNAVKILAQPMPKIPDELRSKTFSTAAIARFHVDENGNATVEILKGTDNAELNQILLNTLKQWKFAPATENGKPVAATFDIRVRFAVE